MRNIWTLRIFTFLAWLLAAGSASYWLLQTSSHASPNPALTRADMAGAKAAALQPDTLAVAHGLGAVGDASAGAAPALAGNSGPDWNPSRFVLSGIMAQGGEEDGLVMLSVDGKPAQLLRVGAEVEPSVVVQALSRQSVTLANTSNAQQPQLLTLKLGAKPGEAGAANASSAEAPAMQVPAQVLNAPPPAAAAPAVAAAAATAPAAEDPAEVAARAAQRESRRAEREERIAERRNANNTANNAANSAQQQPKAADTPAPRRSVLADDNLYFGD